jgi:hypothetical protein
MGMMKLIKEVQNEGSVIHRIYPNQQQKRMAVTALSTKYRYGFRTSTIDSVTTGFPSTEKKCSLKDIGFFHRLTGKRLIVVTFLP